MTTNKLNKKGNAFNLISAGMISFVAFILVILLTILTITTVKHTSMVCPERVTTDGSCMMCPDGFSFNSTGICCNTTTTATHCLGVNQTAEVVYDGAAYNATLDLQDAANLPSQFASVVIIVIIIVGIIGMLGFIGYSAYQKTK